MRILALLAAFLVSCGGGGSSVPPIVLDHQGQIVVVSGDKASFTLEFRDFFRCVQNGHAGVMTHADLAGIAKQDYRGAGLAFGRFDNHYPVTRNLPNLEPVAVLETWSGIPGFDSLYAASVQPLQDGVAYRMDVEASKGYLAYSINGQTWSVDDTNPNVDYSLNNIAFFLAAEGTCPFSIVINRS